MCAKRTSNACGNSRDEVPIRSRCISRLPAAGHIRRAEVDLEWPGVRRPASRSLRPPPGARTLSYEMSAPTTFDARPRTYEIRTYGCQMNVHDSERPAGLLEDAGYARADDDTTPDVVV